MPEGPSRGRIYSSLAVVIVGVIFVLRKSAMVDLGPNWWALFFMLPAAWFLLAAWDKYRRAGGATGAVANNVTLALLVLVVGGVLLLRASWAHAWPFLVVAAGLGGVVRAAARR